MDHSQNRSAGIAVVGAGIAGLACATRLAEAGARVTLFDKGRRPGGRVATRRSGGALFDHGAQFITARNPGFAALVESLHAANILAPWPAAQRKGDIAWAGLTGMSALARAMADRLQSLGGVIHTERHVAWLHDGRVLRHLPAAEARPGSTQSEGGETSEPFDAILFALPAPQVAPILATAGHAFADGLSDVVIAPCWAVMSDFAQPISAPDVLRPTEGPLRWIARDSSRPGHAALPDTWVLHASPAWSRAHLEDDATSVTNTLMTTFRTATGADHAPAHVSAHRWRYALVEKPLGTPFLWDKSSRIGLCGDWCLGPRVEAAYDSGIALALAALDIT